ncbi:hypothetical protein GDO78_017881 [Eleutherodactylus coqui]|uniref:Uncharacterized protein n=1 Tax=Eleutherodactylus coqui TaxID=57060 RepID=A0A8J6B124_ELECQ|nr:hypothetical protein GDO78_017881 [Eleutherodactylus coqui]
MSSNKFRRAYSLRIPRSPKPAAFVDSSGFYDRLHETEVAQDEYHGQNEALRKKDNFSWEIPLITEPPKLHYCRRKWSSKSLRLPKSRQAGAEPQTSETEDVMQVNCDTSDSYQEPEKPSSSEGRRLSNDSERQEIENEGQRQKSKKMKQYKKTIDRAFRRGWDTFITNLYNMSLPRASQDAPHLIKAC